MAEIPASASREFNPADYKEAPKWFVGKFLSQLNLFMRPVYTALSKGLTFAENFNCQYFVQSVGAGATATANAFSFESTIAGTPVEVTIAACNVASDFTVAISSAVFVSWYYSAGVVHITAISGLTSGTTYRLVLRVC